MCYERRSYHENKKAMATEPKKQDTKRDEVVSSLLKDAEKAGQNAARAPTPGKEPMPVK